MHALLRKIGNSKGVILPASVISACGLKNEVNLRIEGNTIVIEALNTPRAHWFDSYVAESDTSEWESLSHDEGTDEWVW
jgi:antitoxin MazE